jgi:hypothetical protein
MYRTPSAVLAATQLLTGWALAQSTATQPLNFFKNYFVTGSYAVGGVGLRGLGDGSGFATRTITMNCMTPGGCVPDGGDIVAAFLYWQTVEKDKSASAGQHGFFNGRAIVGTLLGNPNAPVSWSSGGCSGSSQGTTTMRTYRADVRPFLNVVNGVAPNGPYQVKLADSGSNGGGTPLTLGASLVILYRVLSPPMPLSAISIYDGAFAPANGSQTMSLDIQGFYQAGVDLPGNPLTARITHIVGNGQPNKTAQLTFNGATISNSPFPGSLNGSWDDPTFDVSSHVAAGDVNPVTTTVVPAGTNSGCVSWGAVVFSTTVQDSDLDGILDVWKTNQGYTDISTGSHVSLPGAMRNQKDIFIQIDYLFSTGTNTPPHSHVPKQAAIDMVGKALAAHGIHLHIDLGGNLYQGDPYVITGGTGGGNAIDEQKDIINSCKTPCEFPDDPAIGWKGGFTFTKNKHFQRARKDSYHYALFAHDLGLATNIFAISDGTLTSIVADGSTATVTISSTQVLHSGDSVRVSGGVFPDFSLNGSYSPITVKSATSFTFPAPNVTPGTFDSLHNRGLFVANGPARSTSGWSDLGGADTIITLGLWRSDVPADDQVGSVLVQAGTLMHELGHTLGLRHGGGDDTNCKPNLQSVMSYLFQVRGLPGYDGLAHIDYSGQALPSLNEGSLNGSAGIGPATIYRTRWYAPLNFLDNHLNSTVGGRSASQQCNGKPTNGVQMVRLEGPLVAGAIDWNDDGNTTESGLSQDLNFDGTITPLAGFDDWGSIDLRQIGARRGVFGFSGDVWGTLDDGSGGTLDDGSGGTLDDGSGGTLDDGGGGTLDDGGGGQEYDSINANSTVDPPINLTVTPVGHSVVLNWTPPGFGRIRTYYIWRADTTNSPISATNLPMNIGKVTGTPPVTTFTDNNVKNHTTYTYFVTSALGADSGMNSGNQSGPSNMVTITVVF